MFVIGKKTLKQLLSNALGEAYLLDQSLTQSSIQNVLMYSVCIEISPCQQPEPRELDTSELPQAVCEHFHLFGPKSDSV